jgi:prepilin-type N-terminal cleavage/methylation domain-containing protein
MLILTKGGFILSNRKAFTLLEVVVAIAILAISLACLFGSQSQSLSIATESQFNTTASLLAGLKLAELESGKLEPADGAGDFGSDFPGYKWQMAVSSAADTLPEIFNKPDGAASGRLRRADLTVFWGREQYLYTVRYYFRLRDAL